MMADAGAVLDFWFKELRPEQHFRRDENVDALIAQRFGALHGALATGISDEWRATPQTMLAAIIVLDQFSRNLFRDDPRAFAQDEAARALTNEAIERRLDQALSPDECQFLYMPLMHCEALQDVERCAELMRQAGHAEGEAFAKRHAAAIARFGRYPARNAALGRISTAEETAYLRDNPNGF